MRDDKNILLEILEKIIQDLYRNLEDCAGTFRILLESQESLQRLERK